jgi:hypothetical protein
MKVDLLTALEASCRNAAKSMGMALCTMVIAKSRLDADYSYLLVTANCGQNDDIVSRALLERTISIVDEVTGRVYKSGVWPLCISKVGGNTATVIMDSDDGGFVMGVSSNHSGNAAKILFRAIYDAGAFIKDNFIVDEKFRQAVKILRQKEQMY